MESKYNYGGSENTNTFAYDVFGNLAPEYGPAESSKCAPCYLFRDPVGSLRLVVDGNPVPSFGGAADG